MTRGKKIFVGCLVSVGVIILAVILTVVFIVSWLNSPGPELDGQRLVDANTRIYAELRLEEEDQTVRDLLRLFTTTRNQAGMEALSSFDAERMPSFLRNTIPMFQNLGNHEVREEDLDKVLPVHVYLTESGTTGPQISPLLAIYFPGSGHYLRLVDWFLRRTAGGNSDLTVTELGNEHLFSLEKEVPGWAAIVGTDILYSPEQSVVAKGIGNLQRVQVPPSPPALVRLFADSPADSALRFTALEQGAEALPDLISSLAPGLADLLSRQLQGATSVSGWARFESVERLTGVLLISAPLTSENQPAPDTRFTLELLGGTLRFTLSAAGGQGTGTSRWNFALDGVDELIRIAARKASGTEAIIIRP
jgi:hypothetical protein